MFSVVRTKISKFISSLLVTSGLKEPEKPGNPWEADLKRLANERKDSDWVQPEPAKPDEISEFVSELAKAANKDAPIVVPQKAKRRLTDPTVTDLKSWWGESVATWDPDLDGKNVNSSDQRNKARQAKWFDKGGPSHSEK